MVQTDDSTSRHSVQPMSPTQDVSLNIASNDPLTRPKTAPSLDQYPDRAIAHVQPKGHFMALDGLRGVAALVILLYHRRFWFVPGTLFHGFLAVDFFFLLSGFVIAHAYGEKLRAGKLGFWRFVRLRVERLWPLLFFGAALGCAALLVTTTGTAAVATLAPVGAEFILGGMSLPVPWLAAPFEVNEPTWSLFFELIINIAFALVAGMLNNRRLYLTIAVASILLIVMTAWTGTISVGYTWQRLPLGLVRVTAPFAFGIALHRWWAAGRLPSIPAPFAVLCVVVGVVLCVPQLPAQWDLGYQLVCCLLVFPLVVVSGCQCRVGVWQGSLAALSARLSYPLYVLHRPILKLFDAAGNFGLRFGGKSLLLESAGIVVFALVVERFYDRPLRQYLASRRKRSADRI